MIHRVVFKDSVGVSRSQLSFETIFGWFEWQIRTQRLMISFRQNPLNHKCTGKPKLNRALGHLCARAWYNMGPSWVRTKMGHWAFMGWTTLVVQTLCITSNLKGHENHNCSIGSVPFIRQLQLALSILFYFVLQGTSDGHSW